MIQIANPIYDAVFKYLIEDATVARIFLTALLQREVTDVEVYPHEYSNANIDKKVSVYRVDFAAKVREKDNTLRRVHIELQKQWVDTEIIRFRQYIGSQYNNPANILYHEDDIDDCRNGQVKGRLKKKDYGIPMVFIYLLGHIIDDIEEPILYVRHKSFDYDDHLLTENMPDSFIDSLAHDCIFVQLPLLKNQKREGRLFEILDIFDQQYKDNENGQLLNIDARRYEGDKDMWCIVRRLLMAASNVDVRQDMNIEDEIFLAWDRRDDTIKIMDAQLTEQANQIEEKDNLLAEQANQLSEKDKALTTWAKSLLEQGISPEQIAKMTTLPEGYINNLH